MVKAKAMAFKAVVPGVPKSAKDWELLEEDLRRIGCHGLMEKPWGLQMEEMVAKLLGDKDNRWHRTMRQAPEKWTAKEWQKPMGPQRRAKAWHREQIVILMVTSSPGLTQRMDLQYSSVTRLG